METKLVSILTEAFLSLRDANPYTSLRLWYDEGGIVKFHLTNNPPKVQLQSNDSMRIHPTVPAQEILPDENIITKRTRKRRYPVEQQPSQEISREPCLNTSQEEVASDFEAKQDINVSLSSIPCFKRFDALEESAPLADFKGQANDELDA